MQRNTIKFTLINQKWSHWLINVQSKYNNITKWDNCPKVQPPKVVPWKWKCSVCVLPKEFVMKICAKFYLCLGCNGAICLGSHSEATSKVQENQTIFAVCCQTNNWREHCAIILPRDGDDHLQHRWWWFYDLPVGHISGLLWTPSSTSWKKSDYAWQHLILINQSDFNWRGWMDDDTERGCTLSFTSYWTGSVPPGRSSCSAAWRERGGGNETGRERGQKQKCLKGRWRGLNTEHLDSLEVRPGENVWIFI